jgi:uncharacterized protein (DUF983 family)
MAWTEENERDFLRRREEHFAREAEEDKNRARMADLGLSAKCPECGSHRYTEGIKAESCDECGYGASYW